MLRMLNLLILLMMALSLASAAELPSKKYLNLAAVKTMVAGAEAEEAKRGVHVTLCILDESGNILFLQRGDGAGLNTLQFAQKKARHAVLYRKPSKTAADALKAGNMAGLVMPESFPNQGGLPILIDGQLLGAISASGAVSDVDEAIAQAGIDALFKK